MFKELKYNPKTGDIKVSGYNNDQVTGMAEAIAAGVSSGLKP